MPTISRFLGIFIKMYFTDHNPPHFHAIYQNYEAAFSIETGELIKGKFPKRQRQFVEVWAYLHKEELEANWELLQHNQQPDSISPLRK